MLIFVDKITDRLIYTFDFVFKERGIEYLLTNDWIFFQKSTEIKFFYSEKFDSKISGIKPSTLLFDEAIFTYSLSKSYFYKEECLSFDKIIDPFASVFFILSRMEEYTTKQRDFHDRFEAKNSVLYKYSWLDKVVCDRWSLDIIHFLEEEFTLKFELNKTEIQIIPTFDIDNTFAFKWKDGFRKLASTWKDKFKKDTIRIEARKRFEAGEIKDPYDTFHIIKALKNEGFESKIFWLIGEISKYDKNISGNDVRHQELIKEISKFSTIGLHPSYLSNNSLYYLKNEHLLLNEILKTAINTSRQHFLKINFPDTYNTLISLGFTDDYSMGFADEIGFRAGTCKPFQFFDLYKNTVSNFWIHPFAYMDGTLNQYLKLSPEKAKIKIKSLFDEVKMFGGDFIFIWHNETISEFGIWKDWKAVFDYTLSLKNEI